MPGWRSGSAEIVEVGHTVNRLAASVSCSRPSVPSTSPYRLRTPITVRLDVDGLPDGEQKDRLVTDVDGLTRAVDRLISEARRSVRAGVGNGADLVGVVRDRVAFWSVLAEEQDRAVLLETPEGECAVAVPADDLEAALDALLGNVFAHTPEGVDYRVRVIDQEPPAGVQLVVDDDGPGLPDADVLQRGESRAGSTGLGLDIIRRTAEASGGTGRAPGVKLLTIRRDPDQTFGRPV
jgi:signal transduction histidine kinase